MRGITSRLAPPRPSKPAVVLVVVLACAAVTVAGCGDSGASAVCTGEDCLDAGSAGVPDTGSGGVQDAPGGPADAAVDDAGAGGSEDGAGEGGPADAAGQDAAAGSGEDGGVNGTSEPVVCEPTSRWSPGTPLFVEVTSDWGLDTLAVHGTRLSVTDIDGDGWADLVARRHGTRTDDLAEDGARHHWLLRNTGGGFEDVTVSSGFLTPRQDLGGTTGRPAEVVVTADIDNDGDLDLYTGVTTADATKSLGETSEVLLNDGTGHFTLGAEENPLRRWYTVDAPGGAAFVDYDRDGRIDIWVAEHNYTSATGGTTFQQDRLFRGNGEGWFDDVTTAAGLTTEDWFSTASLNGGLAHSRAWSAAACDLNGDGVTELLASSYGRSPNHLWQGVQQTSEQVGFSNRGVASGYAYDDDFGWHDNQFARCHCQANPGDEGCAEVPAPLIGCTQPNWIHAQDREAFRMGGNSGTTVCADLDNDGHIDLLTTEIKHWWAGSGADGSDLLMNSGEAAVRFDRPTRETTGMIVEHVTGTAWDEGHMTAAVLDVDNDGWRDLYIGASDYAGNRGLLYHQDSAGSFVPVPVADSFEHNRSHGVAVADFDRDGDLDIIVGHSRSRCEVALPHDCYETPQVRAFENVRGQAGNWLQLSLEGGEGTNRAAIGARVTVTAGGVTQTFEVDGGHGHYGMQSDLVVHAGLGDACEAEVTVRWPNADLTTETATLTGGQRYRWTQGGEPAPMTTSPPR